MKLGKLESCQVHLKVSAFSAEGDKARTLSSCAITQLDTNSLPFSVSHLGLFYKQLTKAVDKGPLEIITAIILIDMLSTVLSSATPPCPFEKGGIPEKSNEGTHAR